MIRWQDQIAILGGTFDPPHLGHAQLIRGLFENPGVREVWVLPSGVPPLKPHATSILHRLEMVKLLLETPELSPYKNRIRLELLEIENTRTPSYSIDTLRTLGQTHGPLLTMVIGTDQVSELHRWKGFPELLEASQWLILDRQGHDSSGALEALDEWTQKGFIKKIGELTYKTLKSNRMIQLFKTPAPEVSSTGIRETFNLGQPPPPGLLPESISAYLRLHRIYS